MMWFNSTVNEKPHQGLKCTWRLSEKLVVRKDKCTGAAWLPSACVVRRSLQWGNMRNPCPRLQVSGGTAAVYAEEGGDDVKSAWPSDALGYTHHTMVRNNGLPSCKAELIPENVPQFRLRAATRPHEAGIASNRGSACRGEYVLESCTHRPSSQESWDCPKFCNRGIRVNSVIWTKS